MKKSSLAYRMFFYALVTDMILEDMKIINNLLEIVLTFKPVIFIAHKFSLSDRNFFLRYPNVLVICMGKKGKNSCTNRPSPSPVNLNQTILTLVETLNASELFFISRVKPYVYSNSRLTSKSP